MSTAREAVRPSTMRCGDRLVILGFDKQQREAVFVRRIPAQGKGQPARNFLRFPDFAGLNGPDDDGTTEMSDYDLSRRCVRKAQ